MCCEPDRERERGSLRRAFPSVGSRVFACLWVEIYIFFLSTPPGVRLVQGGRVRAEEQGARRRGWIGREGMQGFPRFSRLGMRESTEFQVDGAPDTRVHAHTGIQTHRGTEGTKASASRWKSTRARISSVFLSVLFRRGTLGGGLDGLDGLGRGRVNRGIPMVRRVPREVSNPLKANLDFACVNQTDKSWNI